jgi:hypothetical protein
MGGIGRVYLGAGGKKEGADVGGLENGVGVVAAVLFIKAGAAAESARVALEDIIGVL